MRRLLIAALVMAGLVMPASAELPEGSKAPDFKTMGAIGGQRFRLHLQEQLQHGPVVIYFFPKAFTQGCTLESKAFADAMPRFHAAGARVIGLSADDVPTLEKFSTEVCRSRVPMAHASQALIDAYDVSLPVAGELTSITNRTSYVIDQDGTIVMVHSEMDYKDHVALTLKAVEELAARNRG